MQNGNPRVRLRTCLRLKSSNVRAASHSYEDYRRYPSTCFLRLPEQMVHTSRAHGRSSSRFVVTTVHGAKNREFDNVCVLWSYQIPPDPELQRRLLYNAITRAKVNCVIFDTRRKDIVMNDPVVTLLGSPKPVFESKPKARKGSHQSRTKTNAKRKK